MSLAAFWSDPLIICLVLLNVIPLTILFVIKLRAADKEFRAMQSEVVIMNAEKATQLNIIAGSRRNSSQPVILMRKGSLATAAMAGTEGQAEATGIPSPSSRGRNLRS